MSVDLVEFLTARLDEDEAVARDFVPEEIEFPSMERQRYIHALKRWVVLYDPARVLADVKAKRAVLALHHPSLENRIGMEPYCVGCWEGGGQDGAMLWPCDTIRIVAGVYADHPDFDPAWRA